MVVHVHCNGCYKANCEVDPSDYQEGEICTVIDCPAGCKISLHECKVGEHQSQMCPTSVIPCINQIYGCPHKFPRSKLISHLRHCPASVVTCKMEWNRWQRTPFTKSDISNEASAPDSRQSSDLLDIALATRDQSILEEALKMPRRLRRSLRNSYTRNFPAVPLIQRNSSLPEENSLEESTGSLDFLAMEDEDEACSDPVNSTPGLPPFTQSVHCSLCKARKEETGLASSITSALDKIKEEHDALHHQHSALCSNREDEFKTEERKKDHQESDVNIDLVMEMFNSFRSKPMKMFTFLCAQDFRRDQFAQHYSTVHCDIQAGLDGWFQMRCPLAVYGCKFTQHRFTNKSHDKVVFNSVTGTFCLTATQEVVKSSTSDTDRFSDLPDEVFMTILGYMDSLTVKNLSLTSKRIRDRCAYILKSKGMVILDWRKINGAWTSTQKVWSFSTVFDKPQKWLFADNVPSMANHLETCSFNIKYEYKADSIELLTGKRICKPKIQEI